VLYPQNGDRIVNIDYVTSLYPIYTRCRQVEDHVDKFSPVNFADYAKLYPQNGDRLVTIDSVTSFHRIVQQPC